MAAVSRSAAKATIPVKNASALTRFSPRQRIQRLQEFLPACSGEIAGLGIAVGGSAAGVVNDAQVLPLLVHQYQDILDPVGHVAAQRFEI